MVALTIALVFTGLSVAGTSSSTDVSPDTQTSDPATDDGTTDDGTTDDGTTDDGTTDAGTLSAGGMHPGCDGPFRQQALGAEHEGAGSEDGLCSHVHKHASCHPRFPPRPRPVSPAHGAAFSVRTSSRSPERHSVIVPSRSVRATAIPHRDANRSAAAAGCP